MTKTEHNKLMKMWREHCVTRARDICEVCGKKGNQAHHIIGRRNHSVRYDVDNSVCLCAGCHTFGTKSAHQDPLWFREQLLSIKGEDILIRLRRRSNQIRKLDYEETRKYLQLELDNISLLTTK